MELELVTMRRTNERESLFVSVILHHILFYILNFLYTRCLRQRQRLSLPLYFGNGLKLQKIAKCSIFSKDSFNGIGGVI